MKNILFWFRTNSLKANAKNLVYDTKPKSS